MSYLYKTPEGLLPCPHCGGEARIIAKPYELKFCVGCDDDTCLGFSGLGWLYDSEQEAAEAWNRRAERTCRVEVERRKLSQTQTAVVKTCSGCGFEFGVEKENTLPFEVTLNVVVPPNYCPHCGARVIKEES